MNFIKFSIFYEYLYSPISWSHKQNIQTKMVITIVQLILLPYIKLKYIFCIFMTCCYIYNFTYLPKNFKLYLKNTILLFTFFLLISIHSKNQSNNRSYNNAVIQIYPLHALYLLNINTCQRINELPLYSLYIPLSILRLLSIHLVYLFLIKFLLLTTNYEQMIQIILRNIQSLTNHIPNQLKLEIMISSQFLKTIFKQIKILKIAYITRNIKLNKRYIIKHILTIYLLFIEQLIINIYHNIYSITNTLYCRETTYKNIKHNL